MSDKIVVRQTRKKMWDFTGAIRYTTSLLSNEVEPFDDRGSTIKLTLVGCDTELLRIHPEDRLDLDIIRNIYKGEIRGGNGVVFNESVLRRMIHRKYHELKILTITPRELIPMNHDNVLHTIDHVVSRVQDCVIL